MLLWATIGLAVFVLVAFLIAFLLGAFRGAPPVVTPTPSASSTPTASVTPTPTPTPTPTAKAIPPTAAQVQHFAEAISSGNTAALEGDMVPQVEVIQGATECCGVRDPAGAVKALDAIEDNLSSTWDFAPTAETLATYRAGDYGQFFPVNAVVGTSSDGYLVSFTLDNKGKVTTLFLSKFTVNEFG